MSYITAHVLDAVAGVPASGVGVSLARASGDEIAAAVTDEDGRVRELGPEHLDAGDYEVVFGTGDYFAARDQPTFYPSVVVRFTVVAGQAHYHIPLLLSAYSYTTYRGS